MTSLLFLSYMSIDLPYQISLEFSRTLLYFVYTSLKDTIKAITFSNFSSRKEKIH
ncbi:unnamed protein product [Phytomonas sp. EM1]|nr:unnamed protein product [Phytomonas sp. EM1]|eukprot:CCW65585.1 unnamed protein product [Phytomonas sp. isolate EM1]